MNNLFWPDENSIEQGFAAHIVQGCQQYCSTLLHLIAGYFRLNNLFSIVDNIEQCCSMLFSSDQNRLFIGKICVSKHFSLKRFMLLIDTSGAASVTFVSVREELKLFIRQKSLSY